jgi:hypothetical protein
VKKGYGSLTLPHFWFSRKLSFGVENQERGGAPDIDNHRENRELQQPSELLYPAPPITNSHQLTPCLQPTTAQKRPVSAKEMAEDLASSVRRREYARDGAHNSFKVSVDDDDNLEP